MKRTSRYRRRKRPSLSSDTRAESLLPPELASLSRGDVISRYHVIKKQLETLNSNPQFPNEAARQVRRQVLEAQLKLIGIENYQRASRQGEANGGGFDSSKWVTHALQNERYDLTERVGSLEVLDVGSIAHRFPDQLEVNGLAQKKVVPLRVTSIDLNPEDSEAGRRVIQADFFDFARKEIAERGAQYDVVCLSLCVNFEGNANRRGLMIHLASKLLAKGGLLFLVLPRACVENSRYLNEERFYSILDAVGLKQVTTTYSLKLMKSISSRCEEDGYVDVEKWNCLARRELLRGGKGRNNFTICLDSSVLKEGQQNDVIKTPSHATGKESPGLRGNDQKKMRKAGKPISRIAKPATTSNQRKKARRARKKQARLSGCDADSESAIR